MFYHSHNIFHIGAKARNVAIIFGLITIIEGVLWYFLPIYFESQVNSLLLVGILISSHPIASVLASLPSGDICDKVGRKFAFILGLIGFAFSFIFLLIGNFVSLLIFMIIYGVFSTMYGISAFVSILDHTKTKYAGEAAGFFTSMQYSGWLFGSLFSGILILLFDFTLVMQILILSLIAIFSFSLFVFPGKSHLNFKEFVNVEHILARDRVFIGEWKSISRLGMPLISIFAFVFAFGYWEYAIWIFEPIYTNYIGAGVILGAAILALISLPGAISAFVAGALTDRIGVRRMLPIGAVLIIIGQLVFLAMQTLATLAMSLIVTSFGSLFVLIPIDYYLKKHVNRKIRGEVDGSAEMFYNIGGIIGPLTIGIALTLSNLTNLYYFTFALFAIAIATLPWLRDI
jgi:putative MFS transporter